MKKLCFVLLLSSCVFAQNSVPGSSGKISNWNGWLDTCSWFIAGSGTVRYSKVFNLTDFENLRVLAMGSDTVVAGFAADSIQLQYGYQTGSMVRNFAGNLDTAWDNRIVIDTLSSSRYAPSVGTLDSAGTLARGWRASDTTSVARFAVQSRNFAPEWDQLVRFWVNGLTNNKGASAVKFVIDVKRRIFTNTRNK